MRFDGRDGSVASLPELVDQRSREVLHLGECGTVILAGALGDRSVAVVHDGEGWAHEQITGAFANQPVPHDVAVAPDGDTHLVADRQLHRRAGGAWELVRGDACGPRSTSYPAAVGFIGDADIVYLHTTSYSTRSGGDEYVLERCDGSEWTTVDTTTSAESIAQLEDAHVAFTEHRSEALDAVISTDDGWGSPFTIPESGYIGGSSTDLRLAQRLRILASTPRPVRWASSTPSAPRSGRVGRARARFGCSARPAGSARPSSCAAAGVSSARPARRSASRSRVAALLRRSRWAY